MIPCTKSKAVKFPLACQDFQQRRPPCLSLRPDQHGPERTQPNGAKVRSAQNLDPLKQEKTRQMSGRVHEDDESANEVDKLVQQDVYLVPQQQQDGSDDYGYQDDDQGILNEPLSFFT